MSNYLLIALGSALGGMARHFITLTVTQKVGDGFPYATFAINITGSAFIGLLSGLVASRGANPQLEVARVFLGVGVLGGFTTFSAFSLQAMTLIQAGKFNVALLYCGSSTLLGVAGAALGHYFAMNAAGPRISGV